MNLEDMLRLKIWDGGAQVTAEEFFSRMGSEEFDFEQYKRSGMLPAILKLSEHFLLHSSPDEAMSEETLSYWRNLGLLKEVHRDPDGDYYVYLPEKLEKGKKYPLLFTIDGNNSNPYYVETLGFTHLAAKEQLIQVIPVLDLPGRNPTMDRDRPFALIDRLIRDYPVDETRIYMTGFSHGGILSQWNGIAHYERFAGICPSGIRPGDGGPKRVAAPFMTFYDYPVTEEVAKAHVPAVYCIGMAEQPEHLPLYHENTKPVFEHYLDEHVSMLRAITRMNETQEIDEETIKRCAVSTDASERAIGLPLVNTHSELYFGTRHYFGDVASFDGKVRTRYIAVENQPHHPSAAWAELSWSFISGFRRDPVTGRSYKEI